MPKQSEIAIEILTTSSVPVPLRVLSDAGVSPETLRRMTEHGTVSRPAAGFYTLPGRIDILDIDWVAFSLQVPDGVIGLLSAATHHDMTQEMTARPQAFVPRSRAGRIKLGGESGAIFDCVTSRNPLFLTEGIETVGFSAVPVKITSKERTLLDLFVFSPFNPSTTDAAARIPEETFLDSLSRCVDDPAFSFDEFHSLAETFGCAEKIAAYTKTIRYGGAPRMP